MEILVANSRTPVEISSLAINHSQLTIIGQERSLFSCLIMGNGKWSMANDEFASSVSIAVAL